MIWNPAAETMDRAGIEAVQLDRLQKIVAHAYERVPFYRKKMDDRGVRPEHIKALRDIELLDFTVKNDLRDNYPYGLFAVPMDDVVRLHASSGTTGRPIVAGYTAQDLSNWTECVARLATAGGVTRRDIAQISFGYGLFTGAFGLHQGLEKIGVTIVPISSGNTERQITLMRDFGSTVLIATPSYAMYLAETAEKMGVMGEIKLRVGLFGAEASTKAMRQELERRWGILATENYGLTEIVGPGVSGECAEKCGMHINEDFFLCEVIDPDTGRALPPGEPGEMVITTLTKWAMPILRYRTRDITRLLPEKCACGRTMMRMEQCKGRTDDMLIIRGVNLFPSTIESVLVGSEGVSPNYEIHVTRENYLDKIEVRVEIDGRGNIDDFQQIESLRKSVMAKLRSVCQLEIPVRFVSPGSLKRFEGKARRVTDLRDQLNA
jgi:phenylacetate-CoA ligase